MRGEAKPEDKIPCIVFARLKKELNLTYAAISIETEIPEQTLVSMAGLSPVGYPSRLKKLADYFRNVHGLDYVTTEYFLSGGPEDTERIENVKIQAEQKKNGTDRERPPFLEILNEE